MILTLDRKPETDGVTMGQLFMDGRFEAFTLEPGDDGEHPHIPVGRYRVVVNWSMRFKRLLPQIVDVPGRLGIRIHPGNTTADTSGCVLLGATHTADTVGDSRRACQAFQQKIAGPLSRGEDVWLDVRDRLDSPTVQV